MENPFYREGFRFVPELGKNSGEGVTIMDG